MKCLGNPKTAARMIREEANSRLDLCNNLRTACDNLILLDKFGFSLEDIEKFNNATLYLFDSVNKGYTDFESILKTLKDDYRLTLIWDTKGKR